MLNMIEFEEWLAAYWGGEPVSASARVHLEQCWLACTSKKDWVRHAEDVQSLYCPPSRVREMTPEEKAQFWRFRLCFLQEELDETWGAKSPEEMVDGLIDLIVVAVGTLVVFGVDVHKAWQEVLQANLSKVPLPPGKANLKRPNPFGLPDLMKPEGWVPPDHTGNVGVLDEVFQKMAKDYKGD